MLPGVFFPATMVGDAQVLQWKMLLGIDGMVAMQWW